MQSLNIYINYCKVSTFQVYQKHGSPVVIVHPVLLLSLPISKSGPRDSPKKIYEAPA